MAISFVQGDIFLAEVQAIAIGLNAAGRLDVTSLNTALHDRYPVFVSEYRKRGRANSLPPGTCWVWRDSQPWIVGLVVREAPQGATRPRYVETAMLNLFKNWQREGLHSLALMQLADQAEWPPLRVIVEQYLGEIDLPVMVYENHRPGAAAPSSEDDTPG
jgi:hypothetical protein